MKKYLPNNRTIKTRAFTLIELLIVVAVLGVLATLVVIRFTGTQSSARDTRRQSDLKQYQNSLEVYANRSGSLYPVQSPAVNVAAICVALGVPTCPDDPQGTNPYRYQSTASGASYVMWTRLERPNSSGVNEYYILCSNGNVGKSITQPSSGTCPL
jgi:prepilin-type N-terminal cleavage/methylation domain-containing protein